MLQTLEEVTRLLEEAKNVSWNEEKLDNFLNTLQQQAKGLRSCVSSPVFTHLSLCAHTRSVLDL